MSRPPEGLSELAYAWGQYEARGTNRLPINSEREAAAFIASAIRTAKAEAWDEGNATPDGCCGLCPIGKCAWEIDPDGPTNPYRDRQEAP